MSFLNETKAFMSQVVTGSPDQRVKSLIGNNYSPTYQKAAHQLVDLLYPLGLLDRDGHAVNRGPLDARGTSEQDDAKLCDFDKVCSAAEHFEDIFPSLAPGVDACMADGDLDAEKLMALRQQLLERWAGKYDDEIDVILVYYLVNEKGLSPEYARSMTGLAAMSHWERYV